MENKILEAMKKAGKPVRPGEVADMIGEESKEVSKVISKLKKSGSVISPKRCYYSLPDQQGENSMATPEQMYQCQTTNCGYIFDPDRGDRKGKIPKGTLFDDLSDDWKCPVCGAGKKMFKPLAGPGSVAES